MSTLRDYEQRWAPQLSSELGEPILRCIAMHAAGMRDRIDNDELTPWWRPSLIVNGKPANRLPQTMFLIMTPTRVLITATQRGTAGYHPVVGSQILILARGDAEITAVKDDTDGLWLYRLRSRAQSAELDLELPSGRGLGAELAAQLREFSVTPADTASGLTVQRESAVASQLLDARRSYRTTSTRMIGVLSALVSLVLFGCGAYRIYEYHLGASAAKGLFIAGAIFAIGAVLLFVPGRRVRRSGVPTRRGRHAS